MVGCGGLRLAAIAAAMAAVAAAPGGTAAAAAAPETSPWEDVALIAAPDTTPALLVWPCLSAPGCDASGPALATPDAEADGPPAPSAVPLPAALGLLGAAMGLLALVLRPGRRAEAD